MVKLSIIVTSYNLEDYIEQCLRSIIPQLSKEVELIIVDDCSKDKTVSIIRSLIREYPASNILFLDNDVNVGVSAARNLGMKLSCGRYIAFVDGDDFVTKDYVRLILDNISTNCQYYLLSWSTISDPPVVRRAHNLPKWNVSVWSRVFRRDIILHLFDENYNWGEDGLFIRQNIKEEYTCGYVMKVVYRYRQSRQGGLSATRTKENKRKNNG